MTLMSLAQVLSDLYCKLRDLPQYLGTSLTEGFLRKYQVSIVVYVERHGPDDVPRD